MTIDLVCGNIGVKATPAEALRFASGSGFESIGADTGALRAMSDADLAKFQEAMKQKGVVFGAAGLGVDFRGEDARFLETLKSLPADAAALQKAGVTRVGTWITPGDRRLTYRANFHRHADRLREVAKILGDHGIRLGLEYVGPKTSWSASKYPFVHTMVEDRELIEAIGRDNVGLVLDSWHWYCAGETPDDIRKLSNKDVVACDLNDAPKGIPVDQQKDNARELPCATGVIDLKGFLEALVSIGYDGPVRAEPFNAALRSLPASEAVSKTGRAMKEAFSLIGG
jgi:sugar phosphate isomerase/epimerase